ncbi:hypothetical protein [Virgibacillus proomii]|nr:hypothetical protein [Virgibacillus proomii]MBU5266265.1 hypothetical protein [Virgibacillus proomii]
MNKQNQRKEKFIEVMAYIIVGTGVGLIVLTALALFVRFVLIPLFS